jgi:hypothetical protein
MEDGLDVYTRPRDPQRPLVCCDESTKAQHREVVEPLPVAAGQPVRDESPSQRHGVSPLFMCCAPLENGRHVQGTTQRTAIDWAQGMPELVDVHCPAAERMVVVQDNLNPQTPAALSAAFEPAEAKRIWERLAFHDTPKHGSWLNMAEIELSVLSRHCLNRRIPDQEALRSETSAWMERRNRARATIEWQFTTADARGKLTKLYPVLKPAD